MYTRDQELIKLNELNFVDSTLLIQLIVELTNNNCVVV